MPAGCVSKKKANYNPPDKIYGLLCSHCGFPDIYHWPRARFYNSVSRIRFGQVFVLITIIDRLIVPYGPRSRRGVINFIIFGNSYCEMLTCSSRIRHYALPSSSHAVSTRHSSYLIHFIQSPFLLSRVPIAMCSHCRGCLWARSEPPICPLAQHIHIAMS